MSDYHRQLKKAAARPSAAQVAETKRRMNLASRLDSLEAKSGELEQGQQDIAIYIQDPSVEDPSPPPVDDGTAPAVPQNVQAVGVPVHEIDVFWDTPPGEDHVDYSVIEFTPSGGSAFTVKGSATFGYATDVAAVSHNVRVKFVDKWSRESAWSATVSATPAKLTADQITTGTLSAAVITLSASGYLQTVGGTTVLDAAGLSLTPTGELSEPTGDVDHKLSNTGGTKWAALNFYDEGAVADHRGIKMRAQGNGSDIRGNIVLEGARGSGTSTTTATVSVSSFSTAWPLAHVAIAPHLWVQGTGGIASDGGYSPNYDSGTVSIGASSTVTLNHGLGTVPKGGLMSEALGGGQFKPLPAVVTTSNQIRVDWMTSTQVRVGNTTTSSIDVRLWLYKG